MYKNTLVLFIYSAVLLFAVYSQPNAMAQSANISAANASPIAEEIVINNIFNSLAGELKVDTSEPEYVLGLKFLTLNGSRIAELENDFVNIEKAYRYADKDVVVVTDGCGGSVCAWTNVALAEITQSGDITLLGVGKMTIAGDGQSPDVEIQADSSLLISFISDNGNERWLYANGTLIKQ